MTFPGPQSARDLGHPLLWLDGFGEVGGLDFYFEGLGGAEVVGGAEDELGAAGAGGDADLVEEDGGFVDVDGIGLSCAEEGDAAADVAGERLHVFERGHLGFAEAGGAGEFLEVELGVAGDDGEAVDVGAAGDQQSFEDLLGGHADFFGDGDGGEIVGIDFVFAEFEGDAEGFKEARAVGLHRVGLPGVERSDAAGAEGENPVGDGGGVLRAGGW